MTDREQAQAVERILGQMPTCHRCGSTAAQVFADRLVQVGDRYMCPNSHSGRCWHQKWLRANPDAWTPRD